LRVKRGIGGILGRRVSVSVRGRAKMVDLGTRFVMEVEGRKGGLVKTCIARMRRMEWRKWMGR
jgi:hypothetical protein